MIAFLIPIKHFNNSNDYTLLWDLLNKTLISICNNEGDFHVFVAANQLLSLDEGVINNTTLVKIESQPIRCGQARVLGADFAEHREDKARKRIALIKEAQKHNPTHFFMMDGDDLISNQIVKFINNRKEKPIFIIDKGYFYKNGKICPKDDFNVHCGSSVVVSSEIVYNNMDNWEWCIEWLGRHKIQRDSEGVSFVPFPASVYCIHSDCTSYYLFARTGNWRLPTTEEIEEFKL